MYREYSISKAVTVGTNNVVISEDRQQEERTFFSITNTSTEGQAVSIAFGQEATAGSGIVLYPGGTYSESRESGYRMNQQNICIEADGAGATVAVCERVSMKSVTP